MNKVQYDKWVRIQANRNQTNWQGASFVSIYEDVSIWLIKGNDSHFSKSTILSVAYNSVW